MAECNEKYFLGMHTGFSGSCVLLSGGGVLYAVAEERLSRIKNDSACEKSLSYVLNSAELKLCDMETIAVDSEESSAYLQSKGFKGKILLCKDEMLNFAFAAFGASGFAKALVVVNDFAGLRFYDADGGKITLLEESETTAGKMYETVTNRLGFNGQGEAGKTMALAACSGLRGAEIALSAQKKFEEDFTAAVLNAAEKYGYEKIVMAGGMALNCIANGKLLIENNDLAKRIFVLPCSGKDGLALGLAYQACFDCLGSKAETKPLDNVYWGRKYIKESADYNGILAENKSLAKVAEGDEVYSAVARLLYQGKIVCCFQNRAEFGPRALGNRSILASPFLSDEAKEKLDSVKSREIFRPYAPSVLEEYADELFEMQGLRQSLFMLFGVRVRREKLPLLKSVCHTDKTSRIQTVNQVCNPSYYRLIREYADLSDVPAVLNTSFNRAGEPIAETPADAVDCFMNTPADALLLQDTLWYKTNS